MNICASKKKSYFDGFLLRTLANFTNIDRQFSKLLYMLFINKLNIFMFSFIKDDSHNSLPRSDWAVYFCVNFICWNWLPFSDEGIKDVFTKLLTFNYNLFRFGVNLRIENSQCVNSISFFSDAWSNWSWIQSIKTRSSDNWNLRSPWY